MKATVEVTTPSDREVTVTRVFNAPARLVFEAHTKPEYIQKWMLGPDGWSMPVCEVDFRVGGRYHYRWRNDSDGMEFGARGEFREITVPERIVHTERMEGLGGKADGPEGESLCTLTLVEQGGKTTLSTTIRFWSQEIRDQVLKTGMTNGMAAGYDRLETLLAEVVI